MLPEYELLNLNELLSSDMNTVMLRALTPTPHKTFEAPPRVRGRSLSDAVYAHLERRSIEQQDRQQSDAVWLARFEQRKGSQRPQETQSTNITDPDTIARAAGCAWTVVHAQEQYEGEPIAWHLL